jgi:hypothetical protein
MVRTREAIREARRRLRAEYGELFDSLAGLLFCHDPIGIAVDNPNTDEYEPEAETILPRLRACKSSDEIRAVVHEEFVRWFGEATAGPPERYDEIAVETWGLWQNRKTLP